MGDNWVCYLLLSQDTNQTYVGASNDAIKRLCNHNRGRGAKRTKGQTWSHVIIVSGFGCKQSCLSFEAGWKRLSKYRSNKKFVNLVEESIIELKYTDHTVWNRFLDLCYFVHNITFIGTKFILNHHLKHPVYHPGDLCIKCHMPDEFDFIFDLPWPDFVEIKI
jgi:predicted GIY-YIG superfamily endonuclease